MNDNKKNFLDEAKKLLDLIDEKNIKKQEDWLFFSSIKARAKVEGFVTEKQIFWLRDIKDRQLESSSREYDDSKDNFRD